MRRLLSHFRILKNRDHNLVNPNPNQIPVNNLQQQQEGNNGDGGYDVGEGRPLGKASSSAGRNGNCDEDVNGVGKLQTASSSARTNDNCDEDLSGVRELQTASFSERWIDDNGDVGKGYVAIQTASSSSDIRTRGGEDDDGDVSGDSELRMASSCEKMTDDDSEYGDASSTDREIEAVIEEAKRESSEEKGSELKDNEEKQRMVAPPFDDCCPICFGNFVVPCRGPCGHWYCGGCLLQYWNYTAALHPCSCPMCSRKITQLTPEASLYQRREAEVVDVLRNVQKYNRLFVGGAYGLILKVFELPLYVKRMFSEMMNPDRPGAHLNKLRLIAMLLGVLYSFSPFDFLRLGRHNVVDIFDYSAIVISFILYGVGLYMRRRRFHNVRELAAMQL